MYCDEKNLPFARLSKCLRLTCVRESDIFTLLCGSKKEDYIKKKSMVSIRYGLQKHFLKIRDFDIVNRPEMKSANDTFEACMLINIKQAGIGVTVHKPAISDEDLGNRYESLDLQTPVRLQNKVFLDFIMLNYHARYMVCHTNINLC